jgi:hypothetical protein
LQKESAFLLIRQGGVQKLFFGQPFLNIDQVEQRKKVTDLYQQHKQTHYSKFITFKLKKQ